MKGKPAHVGGKRTGNNLAITSTEKTPKVKGGKHGLPSTYHANAKACNTD